MESSEDSIDTIMKQIKAFTERNESSSNDTTFDEPALPAADSPMSSPECRTPDDSDASGEQSITFDSEAMKSSGEDTEVPFFLLKVGKICGRDFENLDQVAKEMKALKYAPHSDDSDTANFLKEFNLRFSVAADTLEEVLDLMEVIQNTGVPMERCECEMCEIEKNKTQVFEQQNRELCEQNHELKCEVEALKNKIKEMEANAASAKMDFYGSEDKATVVKHELAKAEAQVKCLKSRVEVLTQGKANAEKAYIGLEELLNTQLAETTKLSRQRDDLVALLKKQSELCQTCEHILNERQLPAKNVQHVVKASVPQVKVVEKVVKEDYVELLVRICQQIGDKVPDYVAQEVKRIKEMSAPSDKRIITIIQFLVDYCLDLQKRVDDTAKETKSVDGEVKAARKCTQRVLRAFENELRFLEKLVSSSDLQDIVFFRPNTGSSLVLDTEARKELMRHSVLVSKFIEENIGSYTREQVENLAMTNDIDVDRVISVMESQSFEEHVRTLIDVVSKNEGLNNEFLYDVFFAQAIMNEVLQKHAQSLQSQVAYVTHENQKLQSDLAVLEETSDAMKDAGKVIKKLQRREKKLRRELERRIQMQEEAAERSGQTHEEEERTEIREKVKPKREKRSYREYEESEHEQKRESKHEYEEKRFESEEDLMDQYEAQIRELRSEKARLVQLENTYKAKIETLTSELEKKDNENQEQMKAMTADFSAQLENWKEKLVRVKDALKVLKADKDALRRSFEELEHVHTVEVGNFAVKVKQFDDKVKLIEQEFQTERREKEELKSQNTELTRNLQDARQEFQNHIERLKTRVIGLQGQYEETIKECQHLRQLNEELTITKEDCDQKVHELEGELQSVTIQKRAAEMKLRTDSERFENEKRTMSSQLTAKMTAVRNEFQEMLDQQEEKYSETMRDIIEASQDYLDEAIDPTNPVSIVSKLRDKLKEFESQQSLYLSVLEDYTDVKEALGLGAQASSASAVKMMQDDLSAQRSENERLKKTIEELNNSVEHQQREYKLAKTDVASTQLWERWARRIYSVMNDSSIATLSSDQLRTALEEAVFASIGQRSVLFKMYILREEKKAFVKFSKPMLVERSRLAASLRPIMLVYSAVKRMQARAGCLPLVVGSRITSVRDGSPRESKHMTLTVKHKTSHKKFSSKAPLRPMVPLLL